MIRIPKEILKGKRKYIFVRQINKKLFQYKETKAGFYECFDRFDLKTLCERENM